MQFSFNKNNLSVYGNVAWVGGSLTHSVCGLTANCVTHSKGEFGSVCKQVFSSLVYLQKMTICSNPVNFMASGKQIAAHSPLSLSPSLTQLFSHAARCI